MSCTCPAERGGVYHTLLLKRIHHLLPVGPAIPKVAYPARGRTVRTEAVHGITYGVATRVRWAYTMDLKIRKEKKKIDMLTAMTIGMLLYNDLGKDR